MWRQRNIGCILFCRTLFPFRFSDDLDDFVYIGIHLEEMLTHSMLLPTMEGLGGSK